MYTLSAHRSLTKDKLVSKYSKVFGERVGCLQGEYYIHLNTEVDPEPKVRAHVALHKHLQETLVQQDILAPVTEPTL